MEERLADGVEVLDEQGERTYDSDSRVDGQHCAGKHEEGRVTLGYERKAEEHVRPHLQPAVQSCSAEGMPALWTVTRGIDTNEQKVMATSWTISRKKRARSMLALTPVRKAMKVLHSA